MSKQHFRILVCEPMAAAGLAILKNEPRLSVDVALNLSRNDLLQKIAAYDALLVRSQTKVDQDIIHAGVNLKLIGRAGVGIDNIDIKAARARDITVINTPTGNSISAAELTIALMMCLARKIPQAHTTMRAGLFERKLFQGVELHGKTLGLIGFGNVGQHVAIRARAFNMRIIAVDPQAKSEIFLEHGVVNLRFDQVIAQSDFLSLHCALSEQTKNIINDKAIAAMKPGVKLINTARGELIDDHAVLNALNNGLIASAAFDVFRIEPPNADDPLLHHPNVILTPHLGASTDEAQLRVSTLLAEQTIDFFVAHG